MGDSVNSSNMLFTENGPPLQGAKYKPVSYLNLPGNTATDVYTCPSGKRALVINESYYNNSGITLTGFSQVYYGSTYQKTSLSAANNARQQRTLNYALEAGEKLNVSVTSANAGVNYWAKVIEFDAKVSLETAKLSTFINGDNTLYTCPAGKSAMVLGVTVAPFLGGSGRGGFNSRVMYTNFSGAGRTVSYNVVNSGDSVASSNAMGGAAVIANNSDTLSNTPCGATTLLNAGDFISFNTNSNASGQFLWITVWEMEDSL